MLLKKKRKVYLMKSPVPYFSNCGAKTAQVLTIFSVSSAVKMAMLSILFSRLYWIYFLVLLGNSQMMCVVRNRIIAWEIISRSICENVTYNFLLLFESTFDNDHSFIQQEKKINVTVLSYFIICRMFETRCYLYWSNLLQSLEFWVFDRNHWRRMHSKFHVPVSINAA